MGSRKYFAVREERKEEEEHGGEEGVRMWKGRGYKFFEMDGLPSFVASSPAECGRQGSNNISSSSRFTLYLVPREVRGLRR